MLSLLYTSLLLFDIIFLWTYIFIIIHCMNFLVENWTSKDHLIFSCILCGMLKDVCWLKASDRLANVTGQTHKAINEALRAGALVSCATWIMDGLTSQAPRYIRTIFLRLLDYLSVSSFRPFVTFLRDFQPRYRSSF